MRYYSSIAVDTSLTIAVAPDATDLEVGAIIGYPTSFPFTIALDPDTAKEELCDVTGYTGTTFTVTRAVDSTSGFSHDVGARVKHVISGRDLREAQQHIAATTNVHGIADTAALATSSMIDAAVSAHSADTTNVHGIADTSVLATEQYVDDAVSGAGGGLVSKTNGTVTTATESSFVVRNVKFSTDAPSGGSAGDMWIQYTA